MGRCQVKAINLRSKTGGANHDPRHTEAADGLAAFVFGRMATNQLNEGELELLEGMRQNRDSWQAANETERALAQRIVRKLLKLSEAGDLEAAEDSN